MCQVVSTVKKLISWHVYSTVRLVYIYTVLVCWLEIVGLYSILSSINECLLYAVWWYMQLMRVREPQHSSAGRHNRC